MAAASITALAGVGLVVGLSGGPSPASSDPVVSMPPPAPLAVNASSADRAPDRVDASLRATGSIDEAASVKGLTFCGRSYPVVSPPETTEPAPAPAPEPGSLLGAPAHLLPFLRRMPKPEVQAMALLLEKSARTEPIWLGFGGAARTCGQGELDCLKAQYDRIAAQIAESGRPATDRLARLAADHASPAVYAMAASACQSYDNLRAPAAHCQLISAERWTQLDPDNLIAWLHLAEAARLRGDSAAVDAALERATLARRSGIETSAWVQQAVDILAQLPGADRLGLAMVVLPPSYALTLSPARMLTPQCEPDALLDETRRRQCDLLTEKVLEHHARPLERSIAIELGSRLGWPADRISTLRSENDVLSALESHSLGASTGESESEGCGYLERELDRRLRSMAIGEVAAAREQLAATGLSPNQLVARHQAWISALGVDRARPAAASAPGAGASAPP